MKVLFVSRSGVQCGVATYTDQIINALAKLGIEIECAVDNTVTQKAVSTMISGIPIHRCWRGSDHSYGQLIDLIMKKRPNIVHVQHEFGIFPSDKGVSQLFQAVSNCGLNLVVTCHTVVAPAHHLGWFFLDPCSRASMVIAHSEGAKNALLKWKLEPKRVKVIPHGTSESCSKINKLEARRHLFLPEEKDVTMALSLGFITQGKMQHEAIHAIAELAKEGVLDTKKFIYLIVGSPGQQTKENREYCRELHDLVHQYRAWNYIRIYPSFVEDSDLPLWYGAADFVITGSHPTAFSISGRSHQEMAFAMPSVSANAELLSDLTPYRSLKYDTRAELRWNIMQMIHDKSLRSALSERSLEFAGETSWAKVAKMHIAAYKEAINLRKKD